MAYQRFWLALSAWLLMASLGTAHAEIPTDPIGLTDYFAKALTKALPEFEITISGPLTLDATPPEHPERRQQVRLNRISDFCARNPAGCERAAADFVTNSSGMVREADAPLEPAMIRAVVRPVGTIAGDYYESSRLSLHDDWSTIAAQMSGGLIAAVPSNDLVLYADAGQTNTVDAMATLAREMVRKSPRPLSATVFKWTKAGWELVSR